MESTLGTAFFFANDSLNPFLLLDTASTCTCQRFEGGGGEGGGGGGEGGEGGGRVEGEREVMYM